jgi:hypothetical protein
MYTAELTADQQNTMPGILVAMARGEFLQFLQKRGGQRKREGKEREKEKEKAR